MYFSRQKYLKKIYIDGMFGHVERSRGAVSRTACDIQIDGRQAQANMEETD